MQRLLLTTLAATAGLASGAHADLVTWGPVQDSVAASDVSTSGTLVTAKCCNQSGSVLSPTVNGVTFANWSPTGWNNAGSSMMATSTSGNAGYDGLLGAARASSESPISNPTPWCAFRIDTLGTLTLGGQYEIQLWFCDQRITANTVNDRAMTYSSATNVTLDTSTGEVTNFASLTLGPLSGSVEADPNNLEGAGDTIFGQHVRGTFTRSNSDPLWILVQGTHPSATLRVHLNGFQIRELPSYVSYCFGDGSGTPCPCGNAGAAGEGCAHSGGVGAILAASGSASVAADDLAFTGTQFRANQPALLFSADNAVNGGAGNPFGDGLRCAGGNVKRLGVLAADAAGTLNWGAGHAAAGGWLAGDTRRFQGWYRDPGGSPCGSAFNLSQGVEVTFAP